MKQENNREQKTIEIRGETFMVDDYGFVDFGDVAIGLLNQQSQYASRYVNGALEGYPNLGEGLQFKGDPADYHDLKIHKDAIDEFVMRVNSYKKEALDTEL